MTKGTRHISLVLTGGGSRAAYQAGALKGVVEVLRESGGAEGTPFASICGISAGAITAGYIASHAEDFPEGVSGVCDLWENLRSDQILKGDFLSLFMLAMRWARDLTLGGLIHGARANHLLNTKPLEDFLAARIDFDAIHAHVESGRLKGVVFTATNFSSGMAVSFFDAEPTVVEWKRSARRGERARITLSHILASAAIPILFRPVAVGGDYYGDGGVALKAPLSPAIHLGAEKILAIGIRHTCAEAPSSTTAGKSLGLDPINLVDIAGVMLNAALMESFEADVERLERINGTLKTFEAEGRGGINYLRQIPILTIQPSKDLGSFAGDQFRRFPMMLRHLLKGLGASDEKGWDLLSYLSFDTSYTKPLMDLGYEDALAKREEILKFFCESSG